MWAKLLQSVPPPFRNGNLSKKLTTKKLNMETAAFCMAEIPEYLGHATQVILEENHKAPNFGEYFSYRGPHFLPNFQKAARKMQQASMCTA